MIRISHFTRKSFVDGPGERVVLFVQGCPIECPGCQNRHLWEPFGGRLESPIDVADTLANLALEHGNITISGGDPFAQPMALLSLVQRLREYPHVKSIIVYTGYVFENLVKAIQTTTAALNYIDVLVDGPFIREMDDPMITYRGSRNQRPIDVPASLKLGQAVMLDWDHPEIVISPEGSAFMPVGLVKEFAEIGDVENTRRCGQTRG